MRLYIHIEINSLDSLLFSLTTDWMRLGELTIPLSLSFNEDFRTGFDLLWAVFVLLKVDSFEEILVFATEVLVFVSFTDFSGTFILWSGCSFFISFCLTITELLDFLFSSVLEVDSFDLSIDFFSTASVKSFKIFSLFFVCLFS